MENKMITTSHEYSVRVYGLVGHSRHLTLDLPESMLTEGEVFGFHEKYYQVRSILKNRDEGYSVNVNWIVDVEN